jgi:hypothetical protein
MLELEFIGCAISLDPKDRPPVMYYVIGLDGIGEICSDFRLRIVTQSYELPRQVCMPWMCIRLGVQLARIVNPAISLPGIFLHTARGRGTC